jgi:hypothetical protein
MKNGTNQHTHNPKMIPGLFGKKGIKSAPAWPAFMQRYERIEKSKIQKIKDSKSQKAKKQEISSGRTVLLDVHSFRKAHTNPRTDFRSLRTVDFR